MSDYSKKIGLRMPTFDPKILKVWLVQKNHIK